MTSPALMQPPPPNRAPPGRTWLTRHAGADPSALSRRQVNSRLAFRSDVAPPSKPTPQAPMSRQRCEASPLRPHPSAAPAVALEIATVIYVRVHFRSVDTFIVSTLPRNFTITREPYRRPRRRGTENEHALLNVADRCSFKSADGTVNFSYEIYGSHKSLTLTAFSALRSHRFEVVTKEQLDLVFENGDVLSIYDDPGGSSVDARTSQ